MDYFQLRIQVSHLVSLMAADCVSAATETATGLWGHIHPCFTENICFYLPSFTTNRKTHVLYIFTHHITFSQRKDWKVTLKNDKLCCYTHIWQRVIQHFNILEWLPTASLPRYWSFHWIPTESHSNSFWRLRHMHMQSVWSHYNIPFSYSLDFKCMLVWIALHTSSVVMMHLNLIQLIKCCLQQLNWCISIRYWRLCSVNFHILVTLFILTLFFQMTLILKINSMTGKEDTTKLPTAFNKKGDKMK